MLIERKTLYDSRVHSHNIPQHCAIQYAQPEKQAKEPCIIGGEYQDNRFLPSNKRKTEKREGKRKFATFKTPGRLNQTQIGKRLEGVDIKRRKLNLAK